MRDLLDKISNFFCSTKTRRAIYLVSIALFIVCVIRLISSIKSQDGDYKNKIKELEAKSNVLETQQKQYDELIKQQRVQIYDLDYKISNIKEKTTVIREYYKIEKAKVDTYDYKEIDSFFRKKYQY
jgi:hypothetical protein